MRLPVVLMFAVAVGATAPSGAETVQKTELLDEGKPVPNLQLRYGFNGAWVIDTKNVMWRDTSSTHYLVTLAEECKQLAGRRSFNFFPSDPTRVFASRSYQVRPMAGDRCDVVTIERLDDARAVTLRDNALRRVW